MITETFKGLIHELVSEAVDDPRDWHEYSQSFAQENNKQRRMDNVKDVAREVARRDSDRAKAQ